ncbi:unnamed protein product [Sphagnum tenellum]
MTNQTNGKELLIASKKREDLGDLTDDHHVIKLMEVIKHGNLDDFENNWSDVNLNRQVALWKVTFPAGAGKAADQAPPNIAEDDLHELERKLLDHLVELYNVDQKKSAPDLNFAGKEKSLAEPAQILRGKIIVEASKNGGEGAKETVGTGEEEQQGEGAKDAVEEEDEELGSLAKLVQKFIVKLTDEASKNGSEAAKEAVEKGEEEQQDEGEKDAVEELGVEIMWKASPHIYPGRTALHVAVAWGNLEIVERICRVGKVNFDIQDKFGYTPLHLACASTHDRRDEVIKALLDGIYSSQEINANVVAKKRGYYFTPLHFAVKARFKTAVKEGDDIDPELLDKKGRTALEVAIHKSDYAMVQTVQNYLERAGIFGNKQAYADSANAILVGAALLATLTFTAWVQIQANDSILFWVSSSFSFYFAIATFLSAAGAAIPSRGSTLGHVRRAVHASALCLAISLACAVAAFATAGFILLPPASEYRRMVTATTVIGGTICFFFLVDFVGKIAKASSAFFLWTDYFRKKTIYKPLADQVKKWLPAEVPKFVKDVKRWYNDNVTEGKKQNE